MSLYNMVRGFNPTAALCLGMLKLDPKNIARFRDAWLSDDGQTIVVLTRTGGGNRDDYAGSNGEMAEVAGFINDEDDDFDSTFARFTYHVPEQFRADTTLIAGLMKDAGKGAGEQGPGAMIAALDKQPPKPSISPDDPRVAEAQAAYERIFNAVAPASA